MKFLPSQLLFFFQNKSTRRNIILLAKFLGVIVITICLYSVFFHLIMLYEGRDYSWITGIYWTLTVMTTLGFGDITFSTDIGLLFTILVLVSGIVLLLIMLPFSFIQFFYSPWLEAQSKIRTPRQLLKSTIGHVVITHLDPISEKLIEKLNRRQIQYVIVVGELQRASELYDAGYTVMVGDVDDPATYIHLQIENAAMVVATGDDLINTSIAFTVREITDKVPIITTADQVHSLDVLEFPGNMCVFQFTDMLGKALAKRTLGLGKSLNIVSSFDKLHIAEISVMQTSLGEKKLIDTGIRENTGAIVIGLWEKGRFDVPGPQSLIRSSNLLLLAGTTKQLDRFEARYATVSGLFNPENPVIILGGGRVGLAAAELLGQHGIDHNIVEKRQDLVDGRSNHIQGDAADIDVLERAGVKKARTAIITTHDDAMNIYLTFYCRQLRPEIQIISRATSERSVSKLHMAGADLVLSYASMGANAIINVLKTDEISMFTEGLNVFSVTMPGTLAGKNLQETDVREKTGCSVIALKSEGKLIVAPDPLIPLSGKDELILIGTTDSERKFLESYQV